MIGAALSVLAALAIGARAIYPRYFERRALRRRPVGPDGIVVGAGSITLHRRDSPGVLLLHGGGDTPQVLADLAGYLHSRGFSVRVPLLSSHGRQLVELATARASTWYADAEKALSEMRGEHEWVGVVGLSIGGALAIQMAAAKPDIPCLVLLAPYVAMPASVRRAATTSHAWGWLVPYFSSFGARSVRDATAAARGLSHGVLTPAILRAFHEVVLAATRALPDVKPATLVIQSRDDNRISVASAKAAFERLGAREKRFVWIDGAAHVITIDYGRERVFELTADWLESHRSNRRTSASS